MEVFDRALSTVAKRGSASLVGVNKSGAYHVLP